MPNLQIIQSNLKKSFTLVELSIVIVIISIMLATVIVSRIIIISAKVNKVQQDYRDINLLMQVFNNTFDCLPGDCNINELPQNIINNTPSACFNLSTTSGMGNSGATALTAGNQIITTGFDTGGIDSNAKRTCSFYEMQALEPQAFGGRISRNNSILGFNSAWAIGAGGVLKIVNNPIISAASAGQTASINSQISANNAAISNCNTFIGQPSDPIIPVIVGGSTGSGAMVRLSFGLE